jgi:hypothetical protein
MIWKGREKSPKDTQNKSPQNREAVLNNFSANDWLTQTRRNKWD